MKITIRKLVLYLLALVPIASVSFAAKAALKVAGGNALKIDDSQIPHGESESSRAVRPTKNPKVE